jgi:hypothetical protein
LLSSGDNGNDEEIRIGKPRPERVLIFPDWQTSGSANHQMLIMVFVDITEDNISELMKSKDSKSTQRAVTRSIKLFRDFLIQKNEPGEFETYTK